MLRFFALMVSIALHVAAGAWVAVASGAVSSEDIRADRVIALVSDNRMVSEIFESAREAYGTAARSISARLAAAKEAASSKTAVEDPAPAIEEVSVAKADPAPAADFGSWRYACEDDAADGTRLCSITQMVTRTGSAKPLFVWRMTRHANGEFISTLQTPADVAKDKGLVLTIDSERNFPLPYEQCYPDGCLSEAKMATDFRGLLSHAKQLWVTVAVLDGRSVRVVFDTAGLASALAALADPARANANS